MPLVDYDEPPQIDHGPSVVADDALDALNDKHNGSIQNDDGFDSSNDMPNATPTVASSDLPNKTLNGTVNIVASNGVSKVALENLHYIQPACPARARRKPKPDLIVMYKLQHQAVPEICLEEDSVAVEKKSLAKESSHLEHNRQNRQSGFNNKHGIREEKEDDMNAGSRPKRRKKGQMN